MSEEIAGAPGREIMQFSDEYIGICKKLSDHEFQTGDWYIQHGWLWMFNGKTGVGSHDSSFNKSGMREERYESETKVWLPVRESDWMKLITKKPELRRDEKSNVKFVMNTSYPKPYFRLYNTHTIYDGQRWEEIEDNEEYDDNPLLACGKAWLKAVGDEND